MEQAELVSSFRAQLERYASHRKYIEKAQEQAASGKFRAEVIERVVLDHEIKASEVADAILPLVPQVEGLIAGIDAEKEEIEQGKASSDEKMEELSLRQAIGELSDEDFEELSKELRETLEAANGRLGELDTSRSELAGVLEEWVDLAARGGQDDGTSEPEPEPDPEPLEASVESDEDDPSVDPDNLKVGGMSDDVSAVFDDAPAAAAVEVEEAGEAIEIGGAEDPDEDEPQAGVDFGFDGGEDGDVLAVEGAGVELNLVDEGEDLGASAEEIGIDLEAGPAEGDDEPQEERRALLLYQEGTAEEQLYPVKEKDLTVGRGRDNDIQIKNDSKVSRFHCKIYRKKGHYYIEDNKSSNGTLVNGELITERRLFGGEEVIIGETFFRFRIM